MRHNYFYSWREDDIVDIGRVILFAAEEGIHVTDNILNNIQIVANRRNITMKDPYNIDYTPDKWRKQVDGY
jgi:hypothetical protein